MLGLHGEAGVVAGQEVLQHRRGLIHGPSIGPAEFGYQPVLEGPRRPFHSALGLGRAGEDLPDPQFLQASGELSSIRRGLRLAGVVLEYRVAVAVQRQRNAPALDQALQQREVASGILLMQNPALTTALLASSTASSRANLGPRSSNQA